MSWLGTSLPGPRPDRTCGVPRWGNRGPRSARWLRSKEGRRGRVLSTAWIDGVRGRRRAWTVFVFQKPVPGRSVLQAQPEDLTHSRVGDGQRKIAASGRLSAVRRTPWAGLRGPSLACCIRKGRILRIATGAGYRPCRHRITSPVSYQGPLMNASVCRSVTVCPSWVTVPLRGSTTSIKVFLGGGFTVSNLSP
jgi:hypothetical protein